MQRKSLRNQLAEVFAGLAHHLPDTSEALKQLCVKADVLVSSAYQPAGRMVYDATKIPFATVHLGPSVGPCPEDTRTFLAPLVNGARHRWGLQPLHDPAGIDSASPLLALHAISRLAYKADAPDAPCHVTGFFFDVETPRTPLVLQRFLESGERPIVSTFGSMVQENSIEVTRVFADAARELSLRIVIQWPWETDEIRALQTYLSGHALVVGHVPHNVLFPRAHLVIHHGGAGTTAATLRAGVPSIVVPHILDQPQWAGILNALGCAPDMILRSNLTVSALTAAIEHTLEIPSYRQAATCCAEHIRSESGVETAADLIETLVG